MKPSRRNPDTPSYAPATAAGEFKFRPAESYLEELLAQWPTHWPPKEHRVSQHDVTTAQCEGLARLLQRRVGEREIERFLAENREVLSMAVWLFSTGHHMSWLFPKAVIRASSGTPSGLIPDYLVAGADSEGVKWFVLELKGADKAAFVKEGKRVYLSSDANKGVCQLMNYLDFAARDQAHLRDGLGFVQMREPRGMLLIGTEDESRDPQIQAFKAAWNRFNPQLTIRSYHALLRLLQTKLQNLNRL